ncbi:MAG: exo-alpha-sialidase, partial [Verrucomicrobiae bacterium]|nr:exo-alpha-sialidase [Verrucomicrobiae bacterium]
TRLRFGADEWDMPSAFFDIPGTKDIGPVITNDQGRLLFAAGGGGLDGVLFKWRWSDDNGATWSPVQLPLIYGRIGPYFPQPINNFYRDNDRNLYLASDGVDGTSFLWGSHDNGHTWFDTGGRTGGRHTIFAFMKNGSILGLGGKASDIDGYMPMSVSHDRGKTWSVHKTPFPAVGPSGQKASFLKLASGRLFAAADYLNSEGKGIPGMPAKSAWVALSEDDGATWHMKTLPGVKPSYQFETRHVAHDYPGVLKDGTIGYSMAAQAPNGVIHLISSKNYPAQHWEMNEAWILSASTGYTMVDHVASNPVLASGDAFADGSSRAAWGGNKDSSGRFVLNGPEVHHYPSGRKQYEVGWEQGLKVGTESYWDTDGNLIWRWKHRPDGSKTWTQFWPNGKQRHESNWLRNRCHGAARVWDEEGELVISREFRNGILLD